MGAGLIDYRRYHNLADRISVYRVDGGALVRGAGDDVRIVDGEPALEGDEREEFRLAGYTQLVGPRTDGSGDVSVGLAAEGPATFVVTSDRLIAMFVHPGATASSAIPRDEVHVLVLPWDLVDSLDMPRKKSMTDRVAGNRTISVFVGAVMIALRIVPHAREAEDGSTIKIGDDDALRMLTQVAAAHRLSVSPESEHERLRPLIAGEIPVQDKEFVAAITDDDASGVPVHLVGRLVGEDDAEDAPPDRGVAAEQAPDAITDDAEPQGGSVPDAGSEPPAETDGHDADGAGAPCPGCGAAARPDDAFCTGCGAALGGDADVPDATGDSSDRTPEGRCPSCQEPLREGVAFCTACGAGSAGAVPAPLVAAVPEAPVPAQDATVVIPAAASGGRGVGDAGRTPVAGPPADGSRRPGRPAGWLLAAAGAVVLLVGGIAVGLMLGGGDDPTPPAAAVAVGDAGDVNTPQYEEPVPADEQPAVDDTPPAPAAPSRERLDLMPAFIDPDPGDPGDVCFGPGPRPSGVAWMEVSGVRHYDDVLQCGSRSRAADADGVLRFDGAALGLQAGDRIVSVGGDFAFDESAVSQRGSRVQWTAVYEGQGICRAVASWGDRGRCDQGVGPADVTEAGGELQIRQRVLSTAAADRGMWAGVLQPSIVVERAAGNAGVPGDVAEEPSDGSGDTPAAVDALSEDELVYLSGELDRIFIEIKAGDYSSGATADDVLARFSASDHPLLGNAAFNAGVIRYANGDCTGAQEALVLAASIGGTPAQDALRERAAAAAGAGCTVDVSELIPS